MKYVSHSVKDTMHIAENLASKFIGGEVVLLNGDLGVGKTVFTKGIALGLKINDLITSPTFTIVREYYGEKLRLYHFDMYRVEDEDELYELGLDEYFNDCSVCVIEWNKIKINAEKVFIVDIKRIDDNEREITVNENFSA